MRNLLASFLLAISCGAIGAPHDANVTVIAVEAGCRDQTVAAQLDDNSLVVSGLLPTRRYLLEIREFGIDLLIGAGSHSGASLTGHAQINSQPPGYSIEPLAASTDDSGEIRLGIEIGKHHSWARLDIVARCRERLAESSSAEIRAKVAIARELSFVHSGSDQSTAIAALTALKLMQRALLEESSPEHHQWMLFQLGSLAQYGGLSAAEQFWFEEAANYSRSIDDERGETWGLRMAASTKLRTGQADADEAFADVQERARRLGMKDMFASVSYSRCVMMRVRGDAAAAVDCYNRSAEDFRALGDVMGESTAARSKATALLYLGRYDEAQIAIDRSLTLAESVGNEDLIVRAKVILAQLARWDGDFERSLGLLQSAYAIEEQTGRQNELAKIERIIAITYELASEPARAEFYYLASLARTEAKGNELVALETRINFASMLSQSGQLRRSLDVLGPSLAEARGSASAIFLADGALQQATTLLALGQPSEALATLNAGDFSVDSLHWRQQIRWRALLVRMGAIADTGAAQLELASAVDRALASGDLTLAMEVAEVLVTLGIDGENIEACLDLAAKIVDRGMRTAGKVRSPSLRNSLLSRLKWFAAVPMVTLPDGAFEPSSALDALRHLEALRTVEQSPFRGDGSDNSTLELERVLAGASRADDSLSPEREALMLAITTADSDREARQILADGTAHPLPPAPTLQLSDQESVIYVVLSGPKPGVLTFSGSVVHWRSGLDPVALGVAVMSLEMKLRVGHADREDIAAALTVAANELGWKHILSGETRRLSIVADGALAAFPWGLLPSQGNPDQPLIETTELVSLQSLRTTVSEPPTSLRIIAATSPVESRLDSLANSDAEVASVRESWASLSQHTVVGRSREAMLEALAVDDVLIHVVAHGIADSGLIEDSGLWLIGDRGEPEFVSAFRLRRSDVNASLIVLGACESGVSRANRSLGIGGVAGSLVDAGSAAVLATRWPVSDRVAAEFAKSFHAQLAADSNSPEAALAAAVRALRRSPFARHPTHWAGWFLLRAGREAPTD